jgi:oxidoreductase
VEQDLNPKVEYKKVDFDKLDEYKDVFGEADVGFCCLGTTRAKSGKDGFIKVDYDYVVNAAKMLKEGGKCNNFQLVSSQGASADSWFLYLGTKGKAEEAVKDLGFERVSVYRPGVILTPRDETRMMEKCIQSLFGAIDSGSKRSMPVLTLAKAIVNNGLKNGASGNETLENADILKAAAAPIAKD